MPSTYPQNPNYNFVDMVSKIKHYRKKNVKVNGIQKDPNQGNEILLEGYRLCEPFNRKYKLQLYGINGQDDAKYWLVHFDDLAQDKPLIADKIDILYDSAYNSLNLSSTEVIKLEIKAIDTSGLSVSTIQCVCIEY
jgi:hypothetical protein